MPDEELRLLALGNLNFWPASKPLIENRSGPTGVISAKASGPEFSSFQRRDT